MRCLNNEQEDAPEQSLNCSPRPVSPPAPENVPGLELPPGWPDWESLMEEALSEARRALLLDEVPVGAVVVSADGTIIGRGHNAPVSACNPAAHAELAALRQAAETSGNYRLNGAVLIVTLEPCLMCTGAVVHSRLRGLVFGACDYKTGAVCSRMEGLDLPFHNHKTVWAGGVKQNECGELLSDFFRARRQAAKKSEQT